VHTKGRNKRGLPNLFCLRPLHHHVPVQWAPIFSAMGGNANAVPGGKDKKGSQGAVEQRLHSEACPLLHISSTVQYGSGYYEDDDVSLNELIRRERIEGVQDTV